MIRVPVLDAEDSPGSAVHRQTLSVVRREQRYLLGTGQAQRVALWANLPNTRNYEVRTLYLDVPGGSWSISTSQRKFRLRQYNGEGPWWFEIKSNSAGDVTKDREQISPAQVDKLGLKPVMAIAYSREEFQQDSDDGLRITIDTDVTVFSVPTELPPSQAMRAPGTPLATLTNLILEVKTGSPKPPYWLPLPQKWPGAKSRWGVAALHGVGSMWAPSRVPG